jgi:GNAT superfamily N-acetyltransferase
MRIRPIQDTDFPTLAALIRSLSEQFIMHESHPEAAADFVRENDEDCLRGFVRAGMAYHVAEREGAIAGFIALRDQGHIYHLFVDQAYHRQGIAKALWQVARQAARDGGHTGPFTVNASNYALPVYEALGFVRTAETQCKNGIYFNPMQLDTLAA